MQKCSDDLADDAEQIALWGRSCTRSGRFAPSNDTSKNYQAADEINLTQRCPQPHQGVHTPTQRKYSVKRKSSH